MVQGHGFGLRNVIMNSTLEYITNQLNIDLNQPLPISLYYSRFKFTSMLKELNFMIGAEIGTENGFYASKLFESNPKLKLFCVDSYQSNPYYHNYVSQKEVDKFYEHAKRKLASFDCEFIRMPSMEAVRKFEPNSLDFVFIDADHRFEFVVNDIIYWSRIVKPGGVVYGHDYTDRFQVRQAVNAYMDAYKIKPWFIFHKRGMEDCWMFVRQEEDQIWT
jgi:hypothetical protein